VYDLNDSCSTAYPIAAEKKKWRTHSAIVFVKVYALGNGFRSIE